MAAVARRLTRELLAERLRGKAMPTDPALAIILRVVVDTQEGIVIVPREWSGHEEHLGIARELVGVSGDLERIVGAGIAITSDGVVKAFIGGTSIESELRKRKRAHEPKTLAVAARVLEKFIKDGEVPLAAGYAVKLLA